MISDVGAALGWLGGVRVGAVLAALRAGLGRRQALAAGRLSVSSTLRNSMQGPCHLLWWRGRAPQGAFRKFEGLLEGASRADLEWLAAACRLYAAILARGEELSPTSAF